MRHKRKMFALTLAAVTLLGVLTACSGNADSNKGSNVDKSTNTANETKVNVVNGKLEPAVTITLARYEDPSVVFKNGETYADNVHTRWARDTLGVNIETLWSSPIADGSFDTKLKLMLSAGEKLPDVFVSFDKNTASMFAESGKLLDVRAAFEKYASPTWKAAMAEVPTAWQPFTKDGKRFAIPIITNTLGTQSPMWIRQDWLDKLNLKAPTTIEELEVVMDAFANQDPDGNGQNDTIALAFGMKDQITGYPVGDSSWIYGMFGAIPDRWYPGEDGKLQYGSVQPGAKAALGKLKDWKDKGYIPNDIALYDFNKIVESVAAGKVGILGGEQWLMVYPGSMMLGSNPTAMYTPYPLPKGIDGQNMRTIGNPYSGAIFLSKDISEEALQAFFHYQNSLYAAYEQDDPFFFKAYQEGYDYVIKDGKAIIDAKQIPGGKAQTEKYTLTGGFARYPSREQAADMKMARGEELTTQDLVVYAQVDAQLLADEVSPLQMIGRRAMLVASEQASADVPEYFQGPATETMTSRKELLNKMQMDTYMDILYGKQTLDAFDAFVDKWKSSGGDAITKEVNEWYESIK